MLDKLESHLHQNFPFLKQKRLLLTVSGGLDSMVLLDLFRKLPYEIGVAHCNFQLRGLESFGDQNFVEDYACQNNIALFVNQFDTKAYAEDHKLSTQVAARELRYSWFYELSDTEHFDYILTAHHADDNLETFLINLSRGTGLEGLIGIPAQNDKIIRPLLAFSRDEIALYAKENKIAWREDSSNASDKYLRNKIRHNIIPLLKELNPSFLAAFEKTQSHLQESSEMVEDASNMIYQQLVREQGTDLYFDLKRLISLNNYKSYLYQWLQDYGFKAWEDIYDLVHTNSGKQVFAKEHRLIKDRDFLILSPRNTSDVATEYPIFENEKEVNIPIKLSFSQVNTITDGSDNTIFVDADKLSYPLILRKWREGDSFHPLGMGGKTKKLSKLFKDLKMSLIAKEECWLLCSNSQIVWVVGIRQDEDSKIDNNTQNRLKIALL